MYSKFEFFGSRFFCGFLVIWKQNDGVGTPPEERLSENYQKY